MVQSFELEDLGYLERDLSQVFARIHPDAHFVEMLETDLERRLVHLRQLHTLAWVTGALLGLVTGGAALYLIWRYARRERRSSS